jgi:hypothetical protein
LATPTVVIDPRFNGPPDTGNGGYVSALLAEHLHGDVAVRLHRPTPLATPLEVRREGDRAMLVHGETLLADARTRPLELERLEVPAAPDLAEAQRASARFPDFDDHAYPLCFVCGPGRHAGDGLRVFAGRCDGVEQVAAPWTPAPELGDGAGRVADTFLWCALDCPGAYAARLRGAPTLRLGAFSARCERPVQVGEPHVVTAWPIESRGRKHLAGSALFDSSGRRCALALATWIAVEKSS